MPANPADRTAAILWARELLSRPFAVLDCETSGIGPDAEICQIAIVDGSNGNTLLDMLIKPQDPIPAEATAIHGVTNDMVTNCPSFEMVWPIIKHYLINWNVVIYNAGYDTSVIKQCVRRCEDITSCWQDETRCAMLVYAAFRQEWNSYRNSYRWPKLPPIPGKTAHNALTDCRATLALIYEMAGADL